MESTPPLPARPAPRPLTEDVPRIYPRRLPEPTRRALLRRGRTIAKVVTVHFTPTALRQVRNLRHGALPAAQLARPLRKSFQDLGGTFMKFGQIIASSPGMFGDEVANEFRACLDTGPAVPFPDVRQRVEEDLGLPLRDAFADFDPEPIGTASIAVVHRARLLDGRVVAVKVLRPEIEHVVATDLDLMQPLLEILVRQTGDQMAGNVLQLLDGFRVQIGEEMDLRNEARSLLHFRRLQNEFDLTLMAVPEPHVDLSGRNVLTMEFFDGVPIDDLAKVAELGHRPDAARAGGDARLLPHDGALGRVPRRRARRQHDAAARRAHRRHRLGHRRAARPVHAPLLHLRCSRPPWATRTAWPVVTKQITDVYGPAIGVAVGLSGDDLTAFFRVHARTGAHPALRRGQPGRHPADDPAADGPGPGDRGAPAQRPVDRAPPAHPAPGAAHGRPGRRA